MAQKNEKVIVNIIYPCYICANEYATAYQIINHIKKVHGYLLEPRQIGYHRPADGSYTFENSRNRSWQVQHYGCPSCWYHTPKINHIEHLMKHIMETHEPPRIEGFVDPDKEENELMESEEESSVENDEGAPEKGTEEVDKEKYNEEEEDIIDEQDTDDKEEELTEQEKAQAELSQAILKRLDDINTMFKKLFE